MKKIFRFSVIISLCAALVSLAGCQKEMDVDPLGESFSFVTVSHHERGGDHMNVGTLVMYSRVLQVSIHELIADPVLRDKIAVTPEYYELSTEDRSKADEYIIQLWNTANAAH